MQVVFWGGNPRKQEGESVEGKTEGEKINKTCISERPLERHHVGDLWRNSGEDTSELFP